jgi:hypothetical protein
MFVIGETTSKVIKGKLELPKEYHLKRRKILGEWKGEDILYLSDSDKALHFITGRENVCFQVRIDKEDRIEIPREFDNAIVEIKGCISSIEIIFHKNLNL